MSWVDIYSGLKAGDELVYERVSYFFTTRTPDNRFMAMSSRGAILTMPDPDTGMPSFPTVSMMRDAQRAQQLVLRSERLPDQVRADARDEEATAEEVEARDLWAPFRRKVTKAWELEPPDAKPMLSEDGLVAWFAERFNIREIEKDFGRAPCATTLRTWIHTRGRSGDRRPLDMESRSGRVPRRRRADPIVVALAKLHALSCNARRGRRQKVAYAMFKKDVQKAVQGKEIVIDGQKFHYEKPTKKLKPLGREIFRQECHRAKVPDVVEAAIGAQGRKALYGGGGQAKEPTRFMEIVEQDDTPFPLYFLIDPINRVPVGQATCVFSMDVFTRCFIGWDVSFDSPSISTWMRAVAHGAEPKAVPERFREKHPGLADVFGYVVGAYLYDNALQNVSKAVEDAGGDLCHSVILAGEGQPTHKAHVERGHQTLQSYMAEIPGGSFDIPLMRKFGYDPEKHVVVTIEEFRVLLAEAIATYHVTPSDALNGRCPLDLWQEQMALHGHSQAKDHDQFLRSIGDVNYITFSRTGCDLHYLDYSGGDENLALLADLAMALGPSKDTVNPSYPVKVKSYQNDIGFVAIWNPYNRRYVEVPCTKQRYAAGTPLWLHLRTRDHATDLKLAFYGEDDMMDARAGLCEVIEDIVPEAAARQRKLMGRLLDRTSVRRYLGDSINYVRVQPSPTGMESKIDHELRATIRLDSTVEPQRRRRGGANVEVDSQNVIKERRAAKTASENARRKKNPRPGAAKSPPNRRGAGRQAGRSPAPNSRKQYDNKPVTSIAPLSTNGFK